jgi:hypothetical protein
MVADSDCTAIAQRLRGVHGDCTTIAPQLHSVHAAFLAIPTRLHYDLTDCCFPI